MAWHLFSVSADNYTSPTDDSNECPCRVDLELFETLVEREMWDRTLEKLLETLPRLLDREDITARYDEFELFDLYDNALLLSFRYNRTEDIWELFETSIDEEWTVEGEETDDARPE